MVSALAFPSNAVQLTGGFERIEYFHVKQYLERLHAWDELVGDLFCRNYLENSAQRHVVKNGSYAVRLRK